MNPSRILTALLVLLCSAPSHAAKPATGAPSAARGYRAIAGVVTAVDPRAGTLTVRPEGAPAETHRAPATARVNRQLALAELKAGDEVTVMMAAVGGTQEVRHGMIGGLPQRPAAAPDGVQAPRAVESSHRFTGTVDAVDADKRSLTLRGANGEVRTLPVAARAQFRRVGGLEAVAAGDRVTLLFNPRSESRVIQIISVHPSKPR